VKETKTLRELFSFPGFYAKQQLQGVFGDPKARIVELKRQKKERYAQDVEKVISGITILKIDGYEISMHWDGVFISALSSDEYGVSVAWV
jgi:hypothetical protein